MEGDMEAPAEEEADESVAPTEEASTELEEAELKPVKVASTDGSDSTKSPVASKNDMGGSAGNIAQGGEEKGGSAPAPQDMGATTEPNMSQVKAETKDGADGSAKSTISGK
jgi:hypothetical protein